MKRQILLVSLAALTWGAVAANAQQVTCEAPAGTQPGTRPSFAWQNHLIALTRLGNHWMPSFANGDSMTSPFWLDQGTAFPYGSVGLQETWYIARDPAPGTAPLYRLIDWTVANHLDSVSTSEGAATLDLGIPHGYAWTTAQPGTLPLRRYYRSAITDHRTWRFDETPAGYTVNATWGAGPTPRFGFQRYGNLLDQCSVIQRGNAIGTKLQNSKVRVGFNPIWGNAIGEMTYLPNGRQVVSHSVGDMVQSVVWYAGPPGGPLLNPTQSGGVDCWDYGATRRWAGSPVLSSSVSGTSPKNFTTEVRPLHFCHNNFQGNDAWSPLAWRGRFRLTTTLGCYLSGVFQEDVVKVAHEAQKDADAPFTDNPINMNNGGWFHTLPFGDCRNREIRVDVVNVATGAIEATYFPDCDDHIDNHVEVALTNRAVRVVSKDNTFALGFVRLGTADYFDFTVDCGWGCIPDNNKIILGVHKFHNILSSTWEREEVFYVLGSPASVLARLQQIHTDGGNCQS